MTKEQFDTLYGKLGAYYDEADKIKIKPFQMNPAKMDTTKAKQLLKNFEPTNWKCFDAFTTKAWKNTAFTAVPVKLSTPLKSSWVTKHDAKPNKPSNRPITPRRQLRFVFPEEAP